jgi:hypothetical protein
VTGNANNVTLNAYVNCVCRQLLRCNVTACVKLRYVRFVNDLKHAENVGFMAKNIVFCKSVGRRMTGIVKILLSTVRTFATLLKCTNYAHQIFLKLQHVENTVLLSLELALKIRVSQVRFPSRPPKSSAQLFSVGRFRFGDPQTVRGPAQLYVCHTPPASEAVMPPKSHTPLSLLRKLLRTLTIWHTQNAFHGNSLCVCRIRRFCIWRGEANHEVCVLSHSTV